MASARVMPTYTMYPVLAVWLQSHSKLLAWGHLLVLWLSVWSEVCLSAVAESNGEPTHLAVNTSNITTDGRWEPYLERIRSAVADHTECGGHHEKNCYDDIIERDLEPWRQRGGIQLADIERARHTTATRYQIIKHKLYRSKKCVFMARCEGIEHFLLPLAKSLPDMDLVINVFDNPQVSKYHGPSPVLSFSRDSNFIDIMYPAWTFWAGGPAVWPIYPTGLGRWDQQRTLISKSGKLTPWSKKEPKAFFRGSRTSAERDPLVLFSRKHPNLAEAAYTKNQAYKSKEDTLGAEPAGEIPLEDHCKYKYLFNFRGVAASFRLKHLFLCKSLVFHVGEDWLEFFYPALKPWVHYIPLSTDLRDLEEVLEFARENDQVAKEIARRGYDFIWKNLKMTDINSYWKTLLKLYAKLQLFKTKKAKDMLEITTTVK